MANNGDIIEFRWTSLEVSTTFDISKEWSDNVRQTLSSGGLLRWRRMWMGKVLSQLSRGCVIHGDRRLSG
ncbi:hypothetical protein KIN20_023890 [Parelaphostrongylus tenuis]|uniref:Uncharacterized protein n=1 Tax=Parelaphostrongylus tenuis TaxID=148309 RepID=A0AAD5QVL7_PARTN|nr:hypothetical protein KIN20_023890 [Parelaphostrongylus tenuis]